MPVSQRFLFTLAPTTVVFLLIRELTMPRLFVAIDIPEQIKEALTRFAAELPVARWVPADQLHLTLRFIGEVGPQTFVAIKGALARLRFQGFPLSLLGAGHFPPGKHPRVLWVGVEPSDPLMLLHQALELALMEVDLAPDERHFSPHLTLARLKETAPAAVSSFEIRHGGLAFPPFEVREIVLYSSVLTNQGAIHRREVTVSCEEAR
jgi:RNA 2',3'-cyclic 3'-phosphodiesterase